MAGPVINIYRVRLFLQDSRLFDPAAITVEMHWHNPGPVRHPPGFIEPCLPTNGRTVPTGSQWAYEIKHDGFRFICRREEDRLRVFSRRGHDWTDRVPLIAEALQKLRVRSVTIDAM